MTDRYVALLRAIAHVPMLPYREKLERLGFEDVASYGMSGNLIFTAGKPDGLEARVEAALGAVTFLRSRDELRRVVEADPYRDQGGASVLFYREPVGEAERDALLALDLDGPAPVIGERVLYLVWPTRVRGRKGNVSPERLVGQVGTSRSSAVVAAVLARMGGG